jgi:hypothetical protein
MGSGEGPDVLTLFPAGTNIGQALGISLLVLSSDTRVERNSLAAGRNVSVGPLGIQHVTVAFKPRPHLI